MAYDALGRNISKTDQAGKITQFGYDKLGRLIRVTDALNQVTGYGYDELGNHLSLKLMPTTTRLNSNTTNLEKNQTHAPAWNVRNDDL